MKEITIIISILVIIFGGAIYTKTFLNKTSEEIIGKLENLKEEIVIAKESNSRERAKELSNDVYGKWEELDKSWPMIVFHEELDSIQISLTKMKAQIEEGELEKSIEELETTKFLINHIKEKEKVNLKNIF